ncbi:unnamed protein product [Ectocarpus sp. 6 AP-2014]
MARLARARIRHERYNECLSVIALAVLCLCLGHDDLFVVLSSVGLLRLEEYHELVAATTLPGMASMPNFMDVIGGFDFWELTRFEKWHFRLLVELLELPEMIEIYRGGFGVTRIPIQLALVVTLWRLSCPTTLIRDRLFWGLSESKVCEIFNLTIEAIHERVPSRRVTTPSDPAEDGRVLPGHLGSRCCS